MNSSWVELVLVTFAAYGFAYIVGYSKIIHPLRKLLDTKGGYFGGWVVDLMTCPACLGFWFGVFGAPLRNYTETASGAFFFGLYFAGTNLAIAMQTGLIRDDR